jgi:hypothetical protein
MRHLALITMFAASLACANNKASDSTAADDQGEVGGEAGGDQAEDAGDQGQDGAESDEPVTSGGETCQTDADCVPAQCCHPTSCVVASAAPDCSDMACTEDCQGGTMDCGQGHCACQDGTCAAVIDQPL